MASFVPPKRAWMMPASFSADPSAFLKSSSVSSPQMIFALPLSWLHLPFSFLILYAARLAIPGEL